MYGVIAKELIAIAKKLIAFTSQKVEYPSGKGPRTLWGRADWAYQVDRGVSWYVTPGHGGLGVSRGAASKYLSPQAIAAGQKSGGTIWYEEDILWVIPFYEVPKWEKIMSKISGSNVSSQSYKENTIRKWVPEYFEEEFIEKSREVAPTLKDVEIGDVVVMSTRPARFEIIEKSGSKVTGLADNGQRYRMPRNTFQDKVIEIIRNRKTIWEK